MVKICVLFCLLFSSATFAKAVPRLTGPVVDEARVLSSTEKRQIEQYIRAQYRNGAGPQLQVLILKSLEGEILEQFSIKVMDKWKIGNKQRDDGILFLVTIKDRKMRIEVGQGLEGKLTDVKSWKIIEGVKPHFRARNFSKGIYYGVQSIFQVIDGEFKARQIRTGRQIVKKDPSFADAIIIIIFLIFFILRLIFGGRGFYMGSFGGGGGFSGGGGWSGGGGGFSGGGASGDW